MYHRTQTYTSRECLYKQKTSDEKYEYKKYHYYEEFIDKFNYLITSILIH